MADRKYYTLYKIRKLYALIKKKKLKLYIVAVYSQTHTSSKTPPTGEAHTVIHNNTQITSLEFIHVGCAECICFQNDLNIILALQLNTLPCWECLYYNKLC